MTDNRRSYYPPNPNYGYVPPTTTRILLWLMHAVGWIILIPSFIAVVGCLFFILVGILLTIFGRTGMDSLISWLVLLAVSGIMMTIGMVMTEKVKVFNR